MLFEFIVWLAFYVVQHVAEVWTASVVCATALWLAQERIGGTRRAMSAREATLRWLQTIRLLRRLVVAAALTVVTSSLMLLAGQWSQWVVANVAMAAGLLTWRWLRARRQRPARLVVPSSRVPPARNGRGLR